VSEVAEPLDRLAGTSGTDEFQLGDAVLVTGKLGIPRLGVDTGYSEEEEFDETGPEEAVVL
jgi:hypothetical protein